MDAKTTAARSGVRADVKTNIEEGRFLGFGECVDGWVDFVDKSQDGVGESIS